MVNFISLPILFLSLLCQNTHIKFILKNGSNFFCHKTVFLSVLSRKFQVYFADENELKILISRKLIQKIFFLFLLTLRVTSLVSNKKCDNKARGDFQLGI